jgi:tyrosyl-tRNA synthetase
MLKGKNKPQLKEKVVQEEFFPQSPVLQELKWRGFIKDCSNIKELDLLCQNGKITLYSGYDLSADSLHIGNLMTLMMCRIFKNHGHNVITLLGGATTKISDPSGRDEARKPLSDEQISHNLLGIAKNFTQILGENIKVVNNYDWLSKKGYLEILGEVGNHFSINRMVKMDSVESRLKRDAEMTFLEFNYMIFQGYDFYHLAKNENCLLQIGGSDQWGNIIQGVKIGGKLLEREIFGLTCPLIAKSDGTKMGKSVNGAVWLAREKLSHFEYFQYFRNLDDADIEKCLKFFTDLTLPEIQKLPLHGREINETKKILAFEATKVVHGEILAIEALESAQKIYESGELSAQMLEIKVSSGNILDVLVESKIANSRGEAKKLISQNSIKIDGNSCMDINFDLDTGSVLQIGKKRFVKISL